ncbi:MAG TPA: hypothetical protein VGX46_19855 [Vicinamibacterales bacterium]|jgi:hypothetical protein|nr:hypothetical protein [Vicinamibacterales bacterium]
MSLARVATAVLTCAAILAGAASDIEPAVRSVMTRYLRFTATELSDLQNGKVVKHGLEGGAAGEIAVVGAVKVHARKAAFLARVHDIARFKSGPDVLQIGTFSRPPALDDLAALTVDANDFDVRACHVKNCGVRLPAAVIQRFERDIDPKAPDAQQRGAALFKQVLLDQVTAYVSAGTGRFEQYDDDPRPVRPIDEFDSVLESSPSLAALVPGLPDHLRNFPASRLNEADDFLYWSKEKFGVAPFITVTHVTIVCPSAVTCVMTTRDVYSSRYIDASLALAIATDAVETPDTFYLEYGNRSAVSALKGGLSSLRRMIVERRARGSLEENLKRLKIQLEKGS